MLSAPADGLQLFTTFYRQGGIASEQFRKTDDGVERCAQFMRNVGQKCRFRPIGRFSRVQRISQVLLDAFTLTDVNNTRLSLDESTLGIAYGLNCDEDRKGAAILAPHAPFGRGRLP